jgi:hypothetical protein
LPNKMKQSLKVTYIRVYGTSKQKQIEEREALRSKPVLESETKCRSMSLKARRCIRQLKNN